MDDKEIRMRIVEAVVPISSKVSLVTDDIVKVCLTLENYVLGLVKEEESAPSTKQNRQRPKRTTAKSSDSAHDPTPVDKSN